MQPELTLFTSNRLDVLVARLARTMAEQPLPPLEREIVLVQSQGMQRWLTLELALHHGIAGGLTTPFPRPFCHWLARRVLDRDELPGAEEIGRQDESLFDRQTLTWKLFQLLAYSEARDTTGTVSEALSYLEVDPDQRKRLQLAARLAGLFDDYQMFRPDMLVGWQETAERQDPGAGSESSVINDSEAWQAALWLDLMRSDQDSTSDLDSDSDLDPGRQRDAPLHERLIQLRRTLAAPVAPKGLPSRISVLGVSSLPPIFIDLLAALSRHIPVSIYFVSPTYHYWGDLRSERETARLARRLKLRPDELLDEQHFQEGHPLLAALGRQGRDFFNLLQQVDDTGGAWQELEFDEPGEDCALHVLQHDILHLIDRDPDERIPLRSDDRSIEIHACHSPLREMEVLRDRLLAALVRNPELRPGDILVQVPDIELYGPYIQAVFGVDRDEGPRLPFSIADRRAGREQPPSEVFLDVLDRVGDRLTVRQVFDLLDTPAIRRRFDLEVDEIPTLRRLVDGVHIRWGMDGAQKRRDFDLPAWDANTWRAGLDRLLMGYAVGSGSELATPLPAGIAPFAGDTAGPADAVGRLASYVDRLFAVLRSLSTQRTLESWAESTLEALDALFLAQTEAEERGLQWVRDEIGRLAKLGSRLALTEAVAPRVVRDHLAAVLHASGFGSGFIDGRITFCALKPMRTIPFRVVCIAGLDDGAFPRRDRHRSFDLIAADPRPGDRSLRDDDRYLFLETLLAARQQLILTHVGRSQKDSSQREPSVVLSELMDQIDRTFVILDDELGDSAAVPSKRAPHQLLRTEHRLQAWSPAYFELPGEPPSEPSGGHPGLVSYSKENARAARALRSSRHGIPRFADEDLPGVEDALLDSHGFFDLELRLDDLMRFWQLPCRHFCELGLGIHLELEKDRASESEPFVIAGLEAFELRQWLLERRLGIHQGQPSSEQTDPNGEVSLEDVEAEDIEILRAEGRLPALDIGIHQLRRQSRRVETFMERLPEFRPAPPRSLDLHLHDDDVGYRLAGTLAHGALNQDQQLDQILCFRCGHLRPGDRLSAWIELLVAAMDARLRGEEAPSALLIGEDITVHLTPPLDAESRVEDLLQGYRRGLGRPLPFFTDASYAYAQQAQKLADPRHSAKLTPLVKAQQVFEGRGRAIGAPRSRPDIENPYVRLAFRGLDALDDPDFAQFAERVWQPILENSREQSP